MVASVELQRFGVFRSTRPLLNINYIVVQRNTTDDVSHWNLIILVVPFSIVLLRISISSAAPSHVPEHSIGYGMENLFEISKIEIRHISRSRIVRIFRTKRDSCPRLWPNLRTCVRYAARVMIPRWRHDRRRCRWRVRVLVIGRLAGRATSTITRDTSSYVRKRKPFSSFVRYSQPVKWSHLVHTVIVFIHARHIKTDLSRLFQRDRWTSYDFYSLVCLPFFLLFSMDEF